MQTCIQENLCLQKKISRMSSPFVNNTVRDILVLGGSKIIFFNRRKLVFSYFYFLQYLVFIIFFIKSLFFQTSFIHNKIESRHRHFPQTSHLHTCVACFNTNSVHHSGTPLFFSIKHASICVSFSLLSIKACLNNIKNHFSQVIFT